MRRRIGPILAVYAVVALALTAAACGTRTGDVDRPGTSGQDEELNRIRQAVEAVLTAPPPRGYAAPPDGVRLRSVTRGADGALILDFSRQLLAGGTGRVLEDTLRQVFAAASAARTSGVNRSDEYRVLVNGVRLESYLP